VSAERAMAERLRTAETSGDTDSMVEAENEILAYLNFDLNETEQGLSRKAVDAIAEFCRDQGVM